MEKIQPNNHGEEIEGQKIRLADIIAEKEPESAASFRAFLKFLRENVTVEELLSDRLAQANLNTIIGSYKHDEELGNPYLPLHYSYERGGGNNEYSTFMLKGDDEHMYYFNEGWPQVKGDKLPPFLRREDIVPWEEYNWDKFPKHGPMEPGMDFTKLLSRTPLGGGSAERYNYNTQQWAVEVVEVDNEEWVGIFDPVDKEKLLQALRILAQDESKLIKFGQEILREREEKEKKEQEAWEREEKRNTFSLSIGGEEIIFRVSDNEPKPLADFLSGLSRISGLLKINPNNRPRLKNFGVKIKIVPPPDTPKEASEPYYYPASPFDERVGNLIEEKAKNRDEITAFFLGAFSHPQIVNYIYRLIAIPKDQLPEDTAFSIGTKKENGNYFIDSQLNKMCLAKLTVTNQSIRPAGFKNGWYVIFAACDLLGLDPTNLKIKKEKPPQTVRIVGVSRKHQSLFYKDVDISEVPIKWLRAAEAKKIAKLKSPGGKKLPPASHLLPGNE